MDENAMRADAALVARGLAASREKAQGLIAAGLATVNGESIKKPAQKVRDTDVLAVLGAEHPYVSRGGLKLEKALRVFCVNAAGAVCLDIGASTGGFTDVLLKNGAAKVYAVDVGTGQLDPSLRDDPRVVSLERVNARALEDSMFPERPRLAVMDVSFISIRLILPAAFEVLGNEGRMIALVKPQFEAGRSAVGKGGIVAKPAVHRQVLREIASRWKLIADTGLTKTRDFLAHLSGDEFALILREHHSDEDIRQTIRQYESALAQRMTVNECDLYISASFGYAAYPEDAQTVDTVCAYASVAMHEVKRANSSNHVLHFTPDLIRDERVLEIERKIREALDQDTIFFNLQPQYDMQHKLRGFEALARMRDSEGSFISPGEFIPVAERVGLVDKVDGAVFRKSAAFFGELLQKSGADITLSVNVSVRHLMKNDFIEEMREVLQTTGIPADKLEIEITESIMIDSVDKALKCINVIRGMGVQIAIDDFGTGYSSLSYLHKFPANLLKVDKSFIDKMNTSESSRQYVAAIISIGHIMGFDVISEGVEEETQLNTLKEIGCDFIQGFIWGKPLMPDAAEALVMDAVNAQ